MKKALSTVLSALLVFVGATVFAQEKATADVTETFASETYAGHAFDRVEAELVATIKNLTERQNSLARTLSTFKKQSKADNSEYAGD